MACGTIGPGRLSDPQLIVAAALEILSEGDRRASDLAGERVLITTGATVEEIDPVRFISNRSSGRMGFALAEAARARGADRSEEHTSELQSPCNLVCRLLLEQKKTR